MVGVMSDADNQSYYSSPSPPLQLQSSPPLSSGATSNGSDRASAATKSSTHTPCAACKILRRRCDSGRCILSPYFPPTDPLKFTTAHKVFGASNIIKLVQELPETKRADAVSSMVYEARMRVRDPVYGSAGVICLLQKQVSELQGELAISRAEILRLKCQYKSNLLALLRDSVKCRRGNTSMALDVKIPAVQMDLDGSQMFLAVEAGDEKNLVNLQQTYNDQLRECGRDEFEESFLQDLSYEYDAVDVNNSSSYVCNNNNNLQLMSPVWEPLWA